MAEPLYERPDSLSESVTDYQRAIVSLIEELEAVNWYNQRAAATKNDSLRSILEHNRDEEKEHASMLIEWMRREDETLAEELKEYLFTEAEITDLESES